MSFAGVQPPGPGPYSSEQLLGMARTMRLLAEYPLADGASRARSIYRNWAQSTNRFRVNVCGAVVEPITRSGTSYQSVLYDQYILSGAAFKIEYPRYRGDREYVARAGLEGVVTAYRAIKTQDRSIVRRPLHEVDEAEQDNSLDRYVRIKMLDCGGGM
jgi:hypothetical protein